MARSRLTAMIALALLALLACKDKGAPLAAKADAGRVARGPVDRPAEAIDAERFGERLKQALLTNQPLDDLVDTEAVVSTSLRGTDYPALDAAAAARGMREKFASALRLTLTQGGSYKLLANRLVQGRRLVKFRMLDAQGALNYHDYVVATRAGRTRAVDVHVLLTGELLSETSRRALLPLAVERNRSLLDRLTGKESSYVKHLPTIAKVAAFQADPRAALAAYATLPAELKQDRNLMVLRLQAASAVDNAEYVAAVDAFRQAFPNDPSLAMLEIDYYYLKKMLRPALDAVQRIEASAGPDAHLNTLRAGLYYELEDLPAARRELALGLALEPDLAEAVTLAIALDLAADDEPAALTKIKDARRAKVDLSILDQNPMYVAFVSRPDTKKKLAASAQ